MRKLLPLIFVVLSGACGAGLATLIADVVAVATSASTYVNMIADFADAVFQKTPDPALQEKVHIATQKARAAAAILAEAARGADHLSKDELEAAFVAFRSAYQELLDLTDPIGVKAPRIPDRALGLRGSLDMYGAIHDGHLIVPPNESFKMRSD